MVIFYDVQTTQFVDIGSSPFLPFLRGIIREESFGNFGRDAESVLVEHDVLARIWTYGDIDSEMVEDPFHQRPQTVVTFIIESACNIKLNKHI